MTRALGGVEKGEAKHMLEPRATAKRNGRGLAPELTATLMAMGDMRTAVAVLLMKNVSSVAVR